MPTLNSRKYQLDHAIVISLHGDGLTNRAIAARMGVPHWTVGKLLPELGLVTNGRVRGKRIIDGTRQQCSECSKWDEITSFPTGRSGENAYKLTFCYRCRNGRDNKRRNASSLEYFKEKSMRSSVRARRLSIPFDLTPDYLMRLYDMQDGLCFYTDIPMVLLFGQGRSRHACSIDRVNYDGGYIQGNVVLATTRVNSMKLDATLDEMVTWMPEWHRRAMEFLDGV